MKRRSSSPSWRSKRIINRRLVSVRPTAPVSYTHLLAFLAERRVHRQQHPRLDVDQRRRHEYEFRADIEVHFTRLLEKFQVLRRDAGDRNIADIDLLLADQVKQQIERTLVVFLSLIHI